MAPKRTRQHVIDDMAVRIVQEKLPEHWIFRTQGKDYGIDAEIEPVNIDGTVTGRIVKAQIKGHESMTFAHGIYKESGIRLETANYWLSFSLPLILFSVDVKGKKVYWADAVGEIRRRFPPNAQQTISIRINQQLDLDETVALDLLIWKIAADYCWRNTFSDLTIAVQRFPEFLRLWEWSHQADWFLAIDEREEHFLKDYYSRIIRLSHTFFINVGKLSNLSFWYEKAKNELKRDYELPYAICAEACDSIMSSVLELLRLGQNRVCKQERAFWLIHDFDLFNTMINCKIPESADEQALLDFMISNGYSD